MVWGRRGQQEGRKGILPMRSPGTGGLLSQEISRALGGHQNGSISSACFWGLVTFGHQLLGADPDRKD